MVRVEPPPVSGASAVDASLAADLAHAALALARRFAAGATMWCVSPAWPAHARHLAVEFVHPVIVGTRALPAVAVTEADPTAALRTLAQPDDVLLAVSTATDQRVARLLKRAPAWGLASAWIGTGPRPEAGLADHVLWLDDPDGVAVFDGRIALLYHVLWELTHVCFEHPGLLSLPTECDDLDRCITCRDEGYPAEVLAGGPGPDITVRTPNGSEQVDTTLVGEVRAGDLVLVHAGTVIAVTDR